MDSSSTEAVTQSNSPGAGQLEIAHVLFIDIVGYSKLLTDRQREKLQHLNQIVRETEQFRSAKSSGKLLRIPAGDGMVLVFFTSPDAPARCAISISRALGRNSDLPLRMGIHSGPVDKISHVDDRPNLAGAGVNIAQRVMDCGDAGHILLSTRSADDLAQYAEWKAQLHPLGDVEVKHGVRIGVVSLYNEEVGNAIAPQKVQRAARARRRRISIALGAAAVLVASLGIGISIWHQHNKSLQSARAETAAKARKSVAILPFENLSTPEQDALFAGGVHREVLANLAKVAELKVISRASVMRYPPGSVRNIKQIAQELGVSYVVEGSVQRQGGRVHVTAQLIDTQTDSNVWAETYDGEGADVIGFQTNIAQSISNQLGAKLSPRESADLSAKPTKDLTAYENYIKGQALVTKGSLGGEREKYVEDNKRAVELLEQAVARDPQFAVAYSALAEANIQLYQGGDNAGPEYRDRAEAALKQAQRLAPDAGETLYSEARIIYYGYHDFEKALATLEQAAKRLPNDADISSTRGLLYRRFGRWQEAFAQFVRAQELDPQELFPYINAGGAAAALRWWSELDRMPEQVLKRFPRRTKYAKAAMAESFQLRGDLDTADAQLASINPDIEMAFEPLFDQAFWKRDYQEARRLLTEAAKYPELEPARWAKEIQLVFVTHEPPSNDAATDAEKRIEQQATKEDTPEVVNALTAVKMILGKKEEAIRLAETSLEKNPLTKDAITNSPRLSWMAHVYVFAGDQERAMTTFANAVQVPNVLWYGPLKYNPVFDELRKDPRFERIVELARIPFPK
jgi:TolB-like protein/tetratricopeptide (TPR) repeat protein/class 3 adenylate cyclase